MRQDPPELTALKRALGRQLAALREAARIGQQQVARKTGYSRSSVAKAESGRQLLTREFWTTADELLKADGDLLASYEQVQAVRQEHERQCREAELVQAYAEAQALRATTTPNPIQDFGALAGPNGQQVLASLVRSVGVEPAGSPMGLGLPGSPPQAVRTEWREQLPGQLVKVLQEWAEMMNRRESLDFLGRAVATAAAFLMSNLNTEELERVTKAVASPSRVDAQEGYAKLSLKK